MWLLGVVFGLLLAHGASGEPDLSHVLRRFVRHDGQRGARDARHVLLDVPGDVARTAAGCAALCLENSEFGCRALTFVAAPLPHCTLHRGEVVLQPATDAATAVYVVRPALRRPMDVVFAVIAGPHHSDRRLLPQLATWLANETAVVFVEAGEDASALQDRLDGEGFRVADGPASRTLVRRGAAAVYTRGASTVVLELCKPPVDPVRRSFNGAWKPLLIVQRLRQLFRGQAGNDDTPAMRADAAAMAQPSFYVVVDDDTFMVTPNLRHVLRATNARTPLYLGLLSRSSNARYMPGVRSLGTLLKLAMANRTYSNPTLFVQGGAGIVLNEAALMLVAAAAQSRLCVARCVQWAGDIRVGCCMDVLGIEPVHHDGFWPKDMAQAFAHGRDALSEHPVSFHEVRSPAQFHATYNATRVAADNETGLVHWGALRRAAHALIDGVAKGRYHLAVP